MAFPRWIALASMVLLAAASGRAEDDPELDSPAPPPPADAPAPSPATAPAPSQATDDLDQEDLPQIRVREYSSSTIRVSKSKKVYLFSTDAELPAIGRIVLMKQDGVPKMAFRVLKSYPEKMEFAAKRVKRYGGTEELELSASFASIEKLGDIQQVAPTRQDQHDIRELEDPELDSSSASASGGGATGPGGGPPVNPEAEGAAFGSPSIYDPELDKSLEDMEFEEELDLGLMVHEIVPIDLNRHEVGAYFGYIRNLDPDGSSHFWNSGGIRYAFTFAHMVFIRKPSVQDNIALELGAYFYKIIEYADESDAYNIMPAAANLRYGINIGQNLGVFFYGGVEKNFILSGVIASDEAYDQLSQILPTGGGGLLFRVGPNWELKIGAGIDVLAAGLVVRF